MKKQGIRNLIVGVDLSNYSKLVVKEAQRLSKELNLPATYVFAYEDIDLYQIPITVDRISMGQIYEDKIRRTYGLDESDNVLVRFGRAEKEIISVAKKFQSPLIIVGYQGRSALSRFFIGSVAEQLATKSPFPLWIHRGEKVILPKKILIPSDFSRRSDKTLKEIENMKSAFKANVEIYHAQEMILPMYGYGALAMEALEKSDNRRMALFKKKHPKLKIIRQRGSVVPAILARSKKFDLIAISPRGPKIKSAISGKVTGKIVRAADRPILVVP